MNFSIAQRPSYLKKFDKRLHIEVVKVNNGAHDYCMKDETRVDGPWEHGQRPVSRSSKTDWAMVRKAAEAGDLRAIPDAIYVQNYGNLSRIAKDHAKKGPILPEDRGVWIYGPTRTGKSRHAHFYYPDAYDKDANKWWDGYQGEEYAILDDLDPAAAKLMGGARRIKVWGDRLAFCGEIKGGRMPIANLKKFVITSNYTIEECFETQRDRDAIKARFAVIHMPWPREPKLQITN